MGEVSFLSLLNKVCKKYENSVAIKFQEQEITYKELDYISNEIANYIVHSFKEESIIGIAMHKGIKQILSIVAILRAGKTYLPIDLSYPEDRIQYILENSGVKNVIVEAAKNNMKSSKNVEYVDFDAMKINSKHEILELIPKYAYAMFTSGSTGRPKGNLVRYDAASNLINWQIGKSKKYEEQYCKTLQLAPISFDVSFQEIFSTLCIGGTLVIVDEISRIDFYKVSKIIDEEKISRVYMPPVYLNEISNLNQERNFPYLKEIMVAGEQLKITGSVKQFFLSNPQCILSNQYGPTETHVVTEYTLEGSPDKWEYKPPIGTEIDNVRILILDENLNEVPTMTWGELYISGICITGSYMNNEEESKKRYLKLNDGTPIYKTGDICRRRDDGIIEYSSRADDQVKIRGFRVELSEIEKNILDNNDVKDCAVIVKDGKFGNKILEAFISMKQFDSSRISDLQTEIKKDLVGKLPEYMLPNKISIMEKLPLSPNGKINKKELAKVENTSSGIDKKSIDGIKSLFEKVLEVENIDEDGNFFELGGNSILANRLIAEINNTFGLNKAVVDLYENPTVNKFIQSLNKKIVDYASEDTVQEQNKEDIAIIGMACRFPNANNQFEFWDNLKQKNNKGTKNTPLKDIDLFDAELFKISPKEAKLLDPQIRIFLECVWNMFEDAGYNPLKNSMNVGVFAGCGINTYLMNNLKNQIDNSVNMVNSMKNLQLLYNNDKDYISTKTSYVFNLTGPSVNVQSACSTSLVALHLACQSIQNGECEYSIAGASTIVLPNNDKYIYSEDMVYSKDGNCNAFDENASGTVFSNGVGCVLLKRLSKAIEDNDNIYAVIKGSAINNDGNDKVGFTAPSVSGQTDVIRKALVNSNIKPDQVEYIEAHGTATKVGDAIEIKALKNVYNTEQKQYCAIGSLKNDIGHMAWSSGIASLIKVVMALKNKQIPPMNNFSKENPELELIDSPFYVNKDLKEWDTKQNKRTAAVSAFGLGGTNAHVILQEYDNAELKTQDQDQCNILTLSAASKESLERICKSYSEFMQNQPNVNIRDVCYTANTGRKNLNYKTSIIFKNKQELIEKLSLEKIKISNIDQDVNKVVFLFSGNGTQYHNMGVLLYENNELFRKYFNKCEETFYKLTNKSILSVIKDNNQDFDVEFSQIAIFAVEYALYNTLLELGIKPDIAIGHSLGEYALACCGGILSIEDAIKLLIKRGNILKRLGSTVGMISVRLPELEIKELLSKNKINLGISAINTKELTVLSGDKQEIEKLSSVLEQDNIQQDVLDIQTAGHTKELEKYLDEYIAVLDDVKFNESNVEIISTVTGEIGANQLLSKEYWCKHMVNPVRFYNAISKLQHESRNIIIEIGANPTLLGLAMEELGDQNVWVSTLRKGKNDVLQFFNALSQIYLNNSNINFEKLYGKATKVSLPTYKFDGKRYWYDYEYKADITNNLYTKELEGKVLDTSEENTFKDWIVMYNDNNKVLAESFKSKLPGNIILIKIDTDDISLMLNEIPEKKYGIVNLVDYTEEYLGEDLDIKYITDMCMEYIQIFNMLVNKNLVGTYFHVDVKKESTVQNHIIRNIYNSLLQVASLENSNLSIKTVLIDSKENIEDSLISELCYNTADEYVVYKNNKRYICCIKRANENNSRYDYNITKDGIYILTGGLGGIGKLVTRWLAKKGAGTIFLLNRRDPSEDEINQINEIKSKYNINICIEKINILHYDEFERFILEQLSNNLDKVKGIFHLAGVINDSTINKITKDQITEVLKPKLVGTWNLHLLSKKYFKQLEIFNLFSSAASFIGNAGQVNHAIANSFLDSMVMLRKEEDLPVSTINWGTWDKVGHLAKEKDIMERLNKKGFNVITPELGIESLEFILANQISHVAVLPMNWEIYTKYYNFSNRNLFKNLISEKESLVQKNNVHEDSVKKNTITDIESYVKDTIENIIGVKVDDYNQSLIKLGTDSLSSIEIRNKFQTDLSIELPANFVYLNPTINNILDTINKLVDNNQKQNTENGLNEPSCQQKRWLKLIEKHYGERVIPIIFNTTFDEKFFIQSIKEVLKRHISLRWYFPDSKIAEVGIDDVIKLHEPILHDFSKVSKGEAIKGISSLITDMLKNMPSPYERISWMLKVAVMDEQKFIILLGVQHIDFDGSSVSTFAKEFKEYYYHYMQGDSIDLGESIGYDKYIEWQRNYMDTQMLYDREFFKGLYGVGKTTLLPNTPKEDLGKPRMAKKITKIKDHEYIAKIDRIAEKTNASRFSVILSAYAKFISKLVGEDIVTIATIVNGRSNSDFKNIIGPFSAPFPLKISVGEKVDNRELIEQCNNEIIEINSRAFYPVADLTNIIPNYKELPIETYFSDIGINYTNYKPKKEKNAEGCFKIVEILSKVEEEELQVYNDIVFKRVPGLHLVINELKDNLAFNFYYHIDRFSQETVNEWIDTFFKTLDKIIEGEQNV